MFDPGFGFWALSMVLPVYRAGTTIGLQNHTTSVTVNCLVKNAKSMGLCTGSLIFGGPNVKVPCVALRCAEPNSGHCLSLYTNLQIKWRNFIRFPHWGRRLCYRRLRARQF